MFLTDERLPECHAALKPRTLAGHTAMGEVGRFPRRTSPAWEVRSRSTLPCTASRRRARFDGSCRGCTIPLHDVPPISATLHFRCNFALFRQGLELPKGLAVHSLLRRPSPNNWGGSLQSRYCRHVNRPWLLEYHSCIPTTYRQPPV